MDEWMFLAGGEAAHRQEAQRALRRGIHAPRRADTKRPIRTAFAIALVALASRLDAAALTTLQPESARTAVEAA